MKNTSTVNEFIDELRDGSPFARGNAAFALSKMGEQALPALIDALTSESVNVRRYAAYVLGEIGDSTAYLRWKRRRVMPIEVLRNGRLMR